MDEGGGGKTKQMHANSIIVCGGESQIHMKKMCFLLLKDYLLWEFTCCHKQPEKLTKDLSSYKHIMLRKMWYSSKARKTPMEGNKSTEIDLCICDIQYVTAEVALKTTGQRRDFSGKVSRTTEGLYVRKGGQNGEGMRLENQLQ